MDFALFSVILLCSIQITTLRRFNRYDLLYLRHRKFALIRYPNEMAQCVDTVLGLDELEIPFTYFMCNPNFKPVKNQPELTHCPGFDCWESQLSMATRLEIVNIMNRYREKVAKGKCLKWCKKNKHRLVYELHWNYALEKNATWLLETCKRSHFNERSFALNKSLLGSGIPTFEETVVTSFKMETGLQSELRSILWRLMYENHLKDWDKESQFRRGDMHDVACAFTCRRGVTFVTDLNETVENGIVGHLSCVFISEIMVKENKFQDDHYPVQQLDTTLQPSRENCRLYVQPEFGVGNHFPTLCARNISHALLTTHDLFDTCDYRPQNMPQLCHKSTYSSLTWEEKFYGLIMEYNWKLAPIQRNESVFPFVNDTFIVDVTECNAPLIPDTEFPYLETFQSYFCTLTEVVSVQANRARCFGWNCADSQLTDSTRMLIVERLNYARNQVAKGECSEYCPQPCELCDPSVQYCNMVKLKWHWFLERKASEIVRNCPTENSIRKNFTYDDEPFPVPHHTAYEEITLLFDLPYYQGQLALPETVEKLFWINTFEDWNEDHQFSRANAQFIGCSIISRPYTLKIPEIKPEMNLYEGLPTHMVCIYATLNESFNSIIDEANVYCCPTCPDNYNFSISAPCWLRFVKEIDVDDSLCTNTLVLNTMNCQIDERCYDGSRSKAWYIQYHGNTSVQTINGSMKTIRRKAFNSVGILYERVYCRFMVFLFLPQVLLWILTLYLIYTVQNVPLIELIVEASLEFKFRFASFNLKTKKIEKKSVSQKLSQQQPSKKTAGSKPPEKISKETPSGAAKPASGVPSKDTIREARPEDDDDLEQEEISTGTPVTVGVEPVDSSKLMTGRPGRHDKKRKIPKRAKTATPPVQKKK